MYLSIVFKPLKVTILKTIVIQNTFGPTFRDVNRIATLRHKESWNGKRMRGATRKILSFFPINCFEAVEATFIMLFSQRAIWHTGPRPPTIFSSLDWLSLK